MPTSTWSRRTSASTMSWRAGSLWTSAATRCTGCVRSRARTRRCRRHRPPKALRVSILRWRPSSCSPVGSTQSSPTPMVDKEASLPGSVWLHLEGSDGVLDVVNPLAPQAGNRITGRLADGTEIDESLDTGISYIYQLESFVRGPWPGARARSRGVVMQSATWPQLTPSIWLRACRSGSLRPTQDEIARNEETSGAPGQTMFGIGSQRQGSG